MSDLIIVLNKRIEELEAERDGYRNGQMQLQDTLSTVMDSNAKWAAENKRLCKRIAELEAENHRLIVQRDGAFERWKSATAKYPNGADGCCCLFDDNENQVQWCTPHAELRDENDALTAERDKLKARVKELEESRDSWKREWRLSNAGLDMAEKRIAELEAENMRLQLMNPCKHTGFEAAPCDICGYPDPRKALAGLRTSRDEWRRIAEEANKRIKELLDEA